MALIEHTNIIIDDFSIAKRQSNRIYTHILTHIHVGTSTFIQTISKAYMMAGTTDPSTAQKAPKNYSYIATPVSPVSYPPLYEECSLHQPAHLAQDVEHPRSDCDLPRREPLCWSSDGANRRVHGPCPLHGRHPIQEKSLSRVHGPLPPSPRQLRLRGLFQASRRALPGQYLPQGKVRFPATIARD
jgi:hypothetical protein